MVLYFTVLPGSMLMTPLRVLWPVAMAVPAEAESVMMELES